jgi:hypothetical protein
MYDSHGNGIARGIKDELTTAILEHGKVNPDRTAYVVPRSEILEEPERSPARPNEKFIVIALPDVSAGEIDYAAQQIGVEVRARPDGTDTECVVLAGGAVAISGQAIQAAAGADLTGQLLVAWMFSDSLEFTEYTALTMYIDDLEVAQQVAQSGARFTFRKTTAPARSNEPVIEVFEHTVVAVEPSQW